MNEIEKFFEYEERKSQLINLTPEEYQAEIKKIIDDLKI